MSSGQEDYFTQRRILCASVAAQHAVENILVYIGLVFAGHIWCAFLSFTVFPMMAS